MAACYILYVAMKYVILDVAFPYAATFGTELKMGNQVYEAQGPYHSSQASLSSEPVVKECVPPLIEGSSQPVCDQENPEAPASHTPVDDLTRLSFIVIISSLYSFLVGERPPTE